MGRGIVRRSLFIKGFRGWRIENLFFTVQADSAGQGHIAIDED